MDRIVDIDEMAKNGFIPYEGIDFDRYFADTIGVTKSQKDRGQKVILKIDSFNAPYVETKPLHNSQQIIHKKDDGSIMIRLDVILNFELEREILGFGENIEVIAPRNLRDRIKKRISKNLQQYTKEIE